MSVPWRKELLDHHASTGGEGSRRVEIIAVVVVTATVKAVAVERIGVVMLVAKTVAGTAAVLTLQILKKISHAEGCPPS